MEFELGRADLQYRAIGEARFVDLLIVDEGSIAAAGIAHPPLASGANDDGVDPRGQRVGEDDIAIQATTDTTLLSLDQEKLGPFSRADGHD